MKNKIQAFGKLTTLAVVISGALACSPASNEKVPSEAAATTQAKIATPQERAAKLAEIKTGASQGPFKPNWESLTNYQIPEWYKDAKFGIFIHWGVYSVPAHNGEWYPRKMYQKTEEELEYHKQNFGDQTEFGYKDFVPMFKAEKFNADEWLKIIQNSGAKYIVPVAEHHDGFSMYDNSYTRWDATEMGPKRDVIGELKEAANKVDIHFGLSSHRAENWWFYDGGREFPSDVQNDEYQDLYGPAVSRKTSESGETPPSQEFMDDWLLRTVEIVDKYQPELIWFDWWMAHEPFHQHVKDFTSYFYNKGTTWENMPALNYKDLESFRSFPPGSAVLDIERGGISDINEYFWQTDTSVSKSSWGYVTNHQYKEATTLIDDLIDIVSKNGSMLLNIGPKPDGTIPQAEIEMLNEMGDWLKLNGEAIYKTRPWITFGEGSTKVLDARNSNEGERHRKDFNASDIRFTQNGDVLYATLMAWPGDNKAITIRSINAENYTGRIRKVELIGHDGELSFEQTNNGLLVKLPAGSPSKHAQVLRIK